MGSVKSSASLIAAILCLLVANPVLAQEFLNPVPSQPPSFLLIQPNGTTEHCPHPCEPNCWPLRPPCEQWGAIDPTGSANHSDNLLTGPGAFKGAVPNGRAYALPSSGNGLLAPNSGSNQSIPSGQYSFGFSKSSSPAAGAPNYGTGLPTVSTSSVDLNVVDNPYARENIAPGQYNPYAVNNQLGITLPDGSTRIINFQETAAEATTFLQQSFADTQ